MDTPLTPRRVPVRLCHLSLGATVLCPQHEPVLIKADVCVQMFVCRCALQAVFTVEAKQTRSSWQRFCVRGGGLCCIEVYILILTKYGYFLKQSQFSLRGGARSSEESRSQVQLGGGGWGGGSQSEPAECHLLTRQSSSKPSLGTNQSHRFHFESKENNNENLYFLY